MTSSTTELAVQKAWAGLSALSAGDEVGVAVAGGSACAWTKFAVWLLKRMPLRVFRADLTEFDQLGNYCCLWPLVVDLEHLTFFWLLLLLLFLLLWLWLCDDVVLGCMSGQRKLLSKVEGEGAPSELLQGL